jgi:hypothetical protein
LTGTDGFGSVAGKLRTVRGAQGRQLLSRKGEPDGEDQTHRLIDARS